MSFLALKGNKRTVVPGYGERDTGTGLLERRPREEKGLLIPYRS